MTTIQKQAHDPRTYREPPTNGQPLLPRPRTMACAGPNCASFLLLEGVREEQMANYAATHGYLVDAGKIFCSKRCVMLESLATKEDAKHIRQPVKVDETPRTPSRATVRTTTDRNNVTLHSVKCDRWLCDNSFEVSPNETPESVARAAAANGFVENVHGTFCTVQCSKQVKAELDSGWADPALIRPEASLAAREAAKVQAEPKAALESQPDAVKQPIAVLDLDKAHGPSQPVRPHPQNQQAQRRTQDGRR